MPDRPTRLVAPAIRRASLLGPVLQQVCRDRSSLEELNRNVE
ncbi:hypothetical protein [Lignipirellula cremea]|nr:hypothetical protein [Lignipirellula cremea]